MISPDLERTLAKRFNATTLVLNRGHVPILSQPVKVAVFIGEAAAKVPIRYGARSAQARLWWACHQLL